LEIELDALTNGDFSRSHLHKTQFHHIRFLKSLSNLPTFPSSLVLFLSHRISLSIRSFSQAGYESDPTKLLLRSERFQQLQQK
jgi:hypothetical protein